MDGDFQEETNCYGDDAPLAPRPREKGYPGGRGARVSHSLEEGPSTSISKRGSRDRYSRQNSHERSCNKARDSLKVTEELDLKWAAVEDKFRCDGCKAFIHENAMVFVLEDKKAFCSQCALERANATKNSKSRSLSQMLLQQGENDVMLIRDAKQIAKAVMRAGDFTSKRRSLPIRRLNDEIKDQSDLEEHEGEDTSIRRPLYDSSSSSGQLPRYLGDDNTSTRRKVRRASEPLSPLQRPKFDNIMIQSSNALVRSSVVSETNFDNRLLQDSMVSRPL